MSAALTGAPSAAAPPPPPAAVQALLQGWHRLECWIAVTAFSFIALVLVIDVLGRELYGPLMGLLGRPAGASRPIKIGRAHV